MGKLVRDNIPDFILAEGRIPHIRVLNEWSFSTELRIKLIEEAKEAADADRGLDTAEEIADVLEVLYTLATINGYAWGSITSLATEKRRTNGGFTKRFYLDQVEEPQPVVHIEGQSTPGNH